MCYLFIITPRGTFSKEKKKKKKKHQDVAIELQEPWQTSFYYRSHVHYSGISSTIT